MPDIDAILVQVDANLSLSVDKFMRLLSFPSVSSLTECEQGILACAEWLKSELDALGFETRVVPTGKHPVVMGKYRSNGAGPKILFYGHYDVQPAEPLDEWVAPPFQPEIKDEDGLRRIYGRGAADSKSQFWSIIEALRSWKQVEGDLPANVTIVLEGEEETGSPSLRAFMKENLEALACDVVFNSDSDMWSRTRPAITTRLKGLLHEKITISSQNGDLHSGHFGNVAVNPIRVLTGILSTIHDDEGKVAIDGFYDGVEPVAPACGQKWEALNVEEALCGVSATGSPDEGGLGIVERMWGRPGVDFNGIWGGNTGTAERSVLPSSASARLTFRLVGQQQPDHIRAVFRKFVENRLPCGCRAEFEGSGGSHAVTVRENSPYVTAAARALDAEWPEPSLTKGTGGAVPAVGLFTDLLGVDCVTMGFILGDDAIHAPNERYDVERLRKGIRSWVRVLSELTGR
ncbi:MAG: M20/M25/M40 family metallo-hydrolase [Alphaproteobacteria bacterium]|nr:M20/M25/M40 family metallo-hydrolase [Alphaproteobacteria bacterium]